MRKLNGRWSLLVMMTLLARCTFAQTPAVITQVAVADWTTVDCTTLSTTGPCTLGQVCELKTVGTTIKLCRCDAANFWKMPVAPATGTVCVKWIEVGQKCGDNNGQYINTKCGVPGAVCMTANPFNDRMDCICEPTKFIEVDNPTANVVDSAYTKICAKKLPISTPGNANDCNKCNPEGSDCYGLPTVINPAGAAFPGAVFSTISSGCKCDVSFSGDTCQTVHVSVGCQFTGNRMQVCYNPHADVDITTAPGDVMYVMGKYVDMHCRGKQLTADTAIIAPVTGGFSCAVGQFLLNIHIPLDKSLPADKLIEENLSCGTKIGYSGNMKRYESIIEVAKGAGAGSHRFMVYCKIQQNIITSLGGFDIISYPTNNRGQSLFADVVMQMVDNVGQVLSQSPVIRVTDLIKVQIKLDPDDTYGAVQPTVCFLSPRQTEDDPHAVGNTILLFTDGCPLQGAAATKQMIFKRMSGAAYNLETDKMQLPKLKTGPTAYLHCKVKICLLNAEDQCMPKTTADCTATQASSSNSAASTSASAGARKKRATADEPYDEESLEMKLTLLGENEQLESLGQGSTITMSTQGFSIVIALLLALVLVAVVVVILLVFKVKSRGAKVDDSVELTNKPQRFALPRVARNNLRI